MFNCPTTLLRYGRCILHQPLSTFLRQSHNHNSNHTRDFSSITEPIRIVNISSNSGKRLKDNSNYFRSSPPFGKQTPEYINLNLRPKFSVLIDFMADRGDLMSIEALRHEMRLSNIEPDVETYNALINYWGRKRDIAALKEIRREMIGKNVSPNSETLSSLMIYHINADDADGIEHLVEEANQHKLVLDLYATKKLANYYEKRGNAAKDRETFNLLIESYGKNRDLVSVTKLREEMKNLGIKPNANTFRAIAKYYEDKGTFSIANFMIEMREAHVDPDVEMYRAFLKCSTRKRDTPTTIILWKEMKRNKMEPDLSIFNALLSHFSTRDFPEISVPVLRKEMEDLELRPDITTFQQLTRYYARVDDMKMITELILQMKDLKSRPDAVYRVLRGFFEKVDDVTETPTQKKKAKRTFVRPDREMFKVLIEWFTELGDVDTLEKIKSECVKRGIEADVASIVQELPKESSQEQND